MLRVRLLLRTASGTLASLWLSLASLRFSVRFMGSSVLDCPWPVYWRLWKECPNSALRLAAGRDGWSYARFCSYPRRDDGHSRPLYGNADQCHLSAFPDDDDGGSDCRCCNSDIRRYNRNHTERYKKGSGVLHRFSAWIYVSCLWGRRFYDRHFPRDDTRVFQGPDVPWRRQRDPWNAPRTGYEADGRLEKVHALYVLDICCGLAGDLWNYSVQWVLVEGRNIVASGFNQRHTRWLGSVA